MKELSACLITRNPGPVLERCLRSLAFAAEIVVLDHGSDDGTRDLCRSFGARLIEGPWEGFGPAKQRVTAAARHRWVLSIDADEEVTPELAAAIAALPESPPRAAYAVNRLSRFLGRWIRHGGWHPEWVVRLFDRERAGFDDRLVHESVRSAGPVGRLDGLLLHRTYASLDQWLEKQDRYARLAAREAAAAGRRVTPWHGLWHAQHAFWRMWLWRRGFLDGPHGLLLASLTAWGVLWKYARIWEATRARGSGEETPA